MNKIDLLWIRACKSLNAKKRCESLYRRFYSNSPLDDYALSQILIQIVEEYALISTTELINQLNPFHYVGKYFTIQGYWSQVSNILISAIRLSNINRYEGYIPTRKYRK